MKGKEIFQARGEPGPRTCIIVDTKCGARGMKGFCTRDLVAIVAKVPVGGVRKDVVFCSAYLPHDAEELPPSRELRELAYKCKELKLPLVVGCDANAQHNIWGSKRTSNRGSALAEFLVGEDWEILNRGSRPTFVTTRCQEVIDITMCSRFLMEHCKGWKVVEEESLSDHRRITFCIEGTLSTPEMQLKRNPRSTDWETFTRTLDVRLEGNPGKLCNKHRLEKEVDSLQETLAQAFQENCRAKAVKVDKKVAWWTKELSSLRTLSRKLWRKAYNSKHEQDKKWELYRAANAQYKHHIIKAKEAHWKNFCTELEDTTVVSRLRRIFQGGTTQGLGSITLPDGGAVTQHEDILCHLIQVHFPDSTIQGGAQMDRVHEVVTDVTPDWHTANKVVTTERLNWAIDSFESYKSPGPDGVYPAMLKKGGQALRRRLLHVLRASVALRHIPTRWREVRVVFLPKPGKCSYGEAKAFRPISLSSFVLKTLERLIDRAIKEGALTDTPLCEAQHAYQEGKSTETALHALVGEIERTLRRREASLGVFIDIEGAFDNTSFGAIERAARSFRISDTLTGWILAMLRNRHITTSYGEARVRALVGRGCPQGGVISPTLWSITVDSLLVGLRKLGVKVYGYADDVAILVSGNHSGEMEWRMQRALDFVQAWCVIHGLRVNPAKTEMVLFTRRRKMRIRPPTIFGSELRFSDEVKYLGVWLDRKLSWKTHINKQTSKAINTFWACRRMMSTTWGLRPTVVKWIYTAVLVPQFSYAAVIWWPALLKNCNRRAMERIARWVSLGMSGALKTTPTLALMVILDIKPPHLLAMQMAKNSAVRLWNSDHWRTTGTGHTSLLKDRKLLRTLRKGSDVCARVRSFTKRYEVFIPDRKDWAEGGREFLQPRGPVWYTDGSKRGDKAGIGIWAEGPRTNTTLRLDTHTTVLQAELAALRNCARGILTKNVRGKHIYICTDSKQVLRELLRVEINTQLLKDCVDLLERIADHNKVKVVWVPGHSGIEGNLKADALAVEGSNAPTIATSDNVGVNIGILKSLIDKQTDREFKRLWFTSEGMAHTKRLLVGPDETLSDTARNLSRKELRCLIGLITGHWPTKAYLNKLGLEIDPTCPKCGEEPEDAHHLITRCKGLEDARWEIFETTCITKLWITGDTVGRLLEMARMSNLLEPWI